MDLPLPVALKVEVETAGHLRQFQTFKTDLMMVFIIKDSIWAPETEMVFKDVSNATISNETTMLAVKTMTTRTAAYP